MILLLSITLSMLLIKLNPITIFEVGKKTNGESVSSIWGEANKTAKFKERPSLRQENQTRF